MRNRVSWPRTICERIVNKNNFDRPISPISYSCQGGVATWFLSAVVDENTARFFQFILGLLSLSPAVRATAAREVPAVREKRQR